MTITQRRGPSFGQWLVLIVFFAFVLPFLLIFGAPALGAIWDAVIRPAHAETTMSVKDYLADAADLQGKVVAIQGSPACMSGMCFLYAAPITDMQTVMFDPAHLDRDTRRALLDCQPLTRTCKVVLTGKAGSGPFGANSIGAGSLRWITRP